MLAASLLSLPCKGQGLVSPAPLPVRGSCEGANAYAAQGSKQGFEMEAEAAFVIKLGVAISDERLQASAAKTAAESSSEGPTEVAEDEASELYASGALAHAPLSQGMQEVKASALPHGAEVLNPREAGGEANLQPQRSPGELNPRVAGGEAEPKPQRSPWEPK